MSRHLMAKMRRRAAVVWNHGVPLGWRDWAIRPDEGGDSHYFGEPWRQHNFPEEHSSAIVHHGEQRYALEVMPVRGREPRPGKEPEPLQPGHRDWSWGIFKHDENKPLNPPWRFPSDWPYEIADRPPVKYYGFSRSPEEARAEAERNWELHKQYVGGGVGDYDLDAIMRDHDPRAASGPGRPGPEEDFGDIFGGGR